MVYLAEIVETAEMDHNHLTKKCKQYIIMSSQASMYLNKDSSVSIILAKNASVSGSYESLHNCYAAWKYIKD